MDKNDEQISKLYNAKDYEEILDFSFSDLLELSNGDRKLFEDLFYNRNHEFLEFREAAENLYNNGRNLLILGKAGIGKSNYTYKLFYDKTFLKEKKLFPIMLDYRKIAPENLSGYKLNFISKMTDYFQQMKYRIDIKENLIENIDNNLYKIQECFEKLPQKNRKKHVLLFLDDLDYAENELLFSVLDFLTPYARSKKMSILLSARPPLRNAIQHNDFKYQYLFSGNVKLIELAPLNVDYVLATRIAPLLVLPKKHSILQRISDLNSEKSRYKKMIKRLGITNLDALKTFEYPFTDNLLAFMTQVSNGNLREVFFIAIEALNFILENYEELENEISKSGIVCKKLTKQHFIDLYFNNDSSKYKLFNLFERRNKAGNCIYYNVLEAVRSFEGSPVSNYFDTLEELGHSKDDIYNALNEMARRKYRLVESHNFTYAVDNVKEQEKFRITKKGRYYLDEIADWEEYITACKGKSKHTLNDILNER